MTEEDQQLPLLILSRTLSVYMEDCRSWQKRAVSIIKQSLKNYRQV